MNGVIGNTDFDWYRYLASRDLDEVNFWQPSGNATFRQLRPGYPYIFKLKKRFGHRIVGFGFFARYTQLPMYLAWELFGDGNGAASFGQMHARVVKYVGQKGGALSPGHQIGCILLSSPVFFPPETWVPAPRDWRDQIVRHKGYDLTTGEGRRVWDDCVRAAAAIDLPEAATINLDALVRTGAGSDGDRFGAPRTIRPRLGQGTFRAWVTDSYGRACAVSGEHSLPALEAAHIQPYGEGGEHDPTNGLLLRADIHRLYDRHLVTVTPDYEFNVSPRLREDYNNGKAYYALAGRRIHLPTDRDEWPDRERLDWHASQLVL